MSGDSERYDAESRPELMRRAIAEIQDAGIEADVWKIEGVDQRADCETPRGPGPLGRPRRAWSAWSSARGADDARVDHWLRAGVLRSPASSASRSGARSGGTR